MADSVWKVAQRLFDFTGNGGGRRRRRPSCFHAETLEDRTLLSINIIFDYSHDTNGFFNDPQRRAALEAAGRLFEDAVTNELAAIVPQGQNTWTPQFESPSTGQLVQLPDMVLPENEVRIFVGARDLGGNTLGIAHSGRFIQGTTQEWFDLVNYRGQQPSPTQSSLWGGSVTFDSIHNGQPRNWYAGTTAEGIASNQVDLYSIAIHEIGHLMGFSMGNTAWTSQIQNNVFVGPVSLAVTNGNGIPTDGGHFAHGVQSDGQLAAMAPSAVAGERYGFTTFDWAAVDDMGWNMWFDVTSSAPKPGQLAVQVFDADGSPLAGRQVSLTSSGGSARTSSGVTDQFGLFTTFVTGGNWNVNVEGAESRLVTVNGKMQGVDVQLGEVPSFDDVFVWDAAASRWRIGLSSGSRFSNQLGPGFSNSVDWTIVQGDFNGDGRVDFAGLSSTGQWWVGLSTGTTFSTTYWGRWSPTAGWQDFQVGDFTGDGRDDIAARTSGGQWWIASSTGSTFTSRFFGTWAATGWQQVLSGDFNNNGRADIAGLHENGQWWFGLSTGSSFATSYWGRWSATAGWQDFLVGDFTGNGRDDVAARTASGQWWIGGSTGSSLSTFYGTQWSPNAGWTDVVVGDFDGDGRADIAGRTASGQWWVGRSTGTSLATSFWVQWSSSVDWVVVVGDFNGDGADDIAGMVADTGAWWVALSNPSTLRFQSTFFGQWSPVGNIGFIGSGEIG